MAPGPPAIDVAVLEELLRGSRGLGLKMAELFEREVAAALEALDAACRADDTEAIRFQAHRMRGTARIVGAQRLAEACALLEGAPAGHGLDERVESVRDEVEPARAALLAHVHAL